MDHAATSFAHGSGTADDPYQIWTPEELALLAKQTKEQTTTISARFKQMADLQMGKYEWYPISAIADFGRGRFQGTYDGNGYTIYGMHIEDSSLDYVGMFGAMIVGSLQNITVKNSSFVSSYSNAKVGSIIGSASIMSSRWSITNCYSDAYVEGTNIVGGLCGTHSNATLTDSTFEGQIVSSGTKVGGLVGEFSSASIGNCKSNAFIKVNNSSANVGGIAGSSAIYPSSFSSNTIQSCICNNTIISTGNVAGVTTNTSSYNINVKDCQILGALVAPAGKCNILCKGPITATNTSFFGTASLSTQRGDSTFSSCYTDCNGEKWYSGQSADWSGFAVVPGINGGRPIQTALYDVALGGDAEAVKQWFVDNNF